MLVWMGTRIIQIVISAMGRSIEKESRVIFIAGQFNAFTILKTDIKSFHQGCHCWKKRRSSPLKRNIREIAHCSKKALPSGVKFLISGLQDN
jgi:hypothetical protein